MKKILTLLCFSFALTTFGQNSETISFSLEEAIQHAMEHNYTSINTKRDVAAALKQKWETTATGLPKITPNIDYRNNLKQPVTLVPSEFFGGSPGSFEPVVFGVPQTMAATATLSQLIFDGSYIVALQASKTFLEYSKNIEDRTTATLRKQVTSAYGNVLLAKESKDILEKNKEVLERNLFETQQIFLNGLTEEEDVEQLQITLSNLTIQLNNATRVLELSKQFLNLVLGIDIATQIELTDSLESLVIQHLNLSILENELQLEQNVEYRIAQNFSEQRRLEHKQERFKALPTLSAFVNYGTQANSDSFSFLESEQKWFQSSIMGVSLQVPIFSSLGRHARTQRAKIAYEQAQTQLEETIQNIKLQLNTARNNYQFAIENYQVAQANLSLAERIKQKNQIKFFEGLSSSFELRQAQMQLYSAQNEFLQASLNIITEKAELQRILYTPL